MNHQPGQKAATVTISKQKLLTRCLHRGGEGRVGPGVGWEVGGGDWSVTGNFRKRTWNILCLWTGSCHYYILTPIFPCFCWFIVLLHGCEWSVTEFFHEKILSIFICASPMQNKIKFNWHCVIGEGIKKTNQKKTCKKSKRFVLKSLNSEQFSKPTPKSKYLFRNAKYCIYSGREGVSVGLNLDIYRGIAFRLGMTTEIIELYILIPMSVTLIFIQGHCFVRNSTLIFFQLFQLIWVKFCMLSQTIALLNFMLDLFCTISIQGREFYLYDFYVFRCLSTSLF